MTRYRFPMQSCLWELFRIAFHGFIFLFFSYQELVQRYKDIKKINCKHISAKKIKKIAIFFCLLEILFGIFPFRKNQPPNP